MSMGNGAGLKALQVVANAERVLAIELLAGAQAVEFLAPLEPGVGVRAARAFVRTLSDRVREDRSLIGGHRARCRRDRTDGWSARSGRGDRRRRRMSDLPPRRIRTGSSALFHAGLAVVILIFAGLTGGNLTRAVAFAALYFVAATGWTWFRFRQRERARRTSSPCMASAQREL